MKIDHIRNSVRFLLFSYLFSIACNAQVPANTNSNKNLVGKSKISKTQGSDHYQDISCGLEDKAGNLWFGTSGEGVYYYDRKSFTQFSIQNGLNGNSVRSLFEDKKGTIWFATSKGLCFYDGNTVVQVSQSLKNNGLNASLNDVFSIMQDRNGILWFGTADGIVCYDGTNFSDFLSNPAIQNDNNLSLKSVQCIFEDKKGTIWFGSGPMAFEGLCAYDGKSLINFKPQNQTWIRNISEDKNNRLLLTTRGAGVLAYDGKNFTTIRKPVALREDLLTYFLTDSSGKQWFASDYVNDNDITTGGFWNFDGKAFTEFKKENGLKWTSVTFILEDSTKNLWIGTRNDGLYCYDGSNFVCFSE